jgi:hypothetical protein
MEIREETGLVAPFVRRRSLHAADQNGKKALLSAGRQMASCWKLH